MTDTGDGQPKKRGRKSKKDSLVNATSEKLGKLNISVIENSSPVNEDAVVKNVEPSQQNKDFLCLSISPELIHGKQTLERCPALENRPGYFEILETFGEVYPKTTEVYCWWCCHSFQTHPIGIPLKYDATHDLFKVIGCFCSFNCAYAYSKKEKFKVHLSEFKFMYEKLIGQECAHDDWNIPPAPERYVLQRFGGPLTIEEYRSSFHNTFDVMFAPMVPYGMLCDEILGKSSSRGWTKDGVRRPLEVRRAKKDLAVESAAMKEIAPDKKTSVRKTKQRTTVNQLISFS